MSQTFDIVINNVLARLLFSEVDKKIPGKSAELSAELKAALLDLFEKKNLREAIEFTTPYSVNVLTEKEFKKKRKSYNPKRDTYDMMDNIVGEDPPRWWRNEGSTLTNVLPKLKELFGGNRDIVVRFLRSGTMDLGETEESQRELAENIVLNFVGEEEEEEAKPAAAPGPRAPAVPAAPVKPCVTLLSDAGITSRKDFLRWSVSNHPDKGGDTKIFQEISACVDKQYGSARKTRRRQKKRRSTRKSRKSTASGKA